MGTLAEKPINKCSISDPVTPKEAAGLLGVSVKLVQRLARSGRVGAESVGGMWVLSMNSVREYVRTRRARERLADLGAQTGLTDPVDVRTAAQLIGLSRQQVHKLAAQGRLRSARAGGFLFVERSDARAYLKRARRKPWERDGD